MLRRENIWNIILWPSTEHGIKVSYGNSVMNGSSYIGGETHIK